MFPLPGRMFFKPFGGVIEAVKPGMVDYGVIPIKNNPYGSSVPFTSFSRPQM
jgi:prephenate dehydratase